MSKKALAHAYQDLENCINGCYNWRAILNSCEMVIKRYDYKNWVRLRPAIAKLRLR